MKLNRSAKRLRDKKVRGQAKQKFTLLEFQKALSIALEMRRASRGHLFSKLKIHQKSKLPMCVFCDATQKTKKDCEYSELTLIDRIQTILINPDFFTDDDVQALWFQHAAEYQGIQIPLLVERKDA